MKNKKLNKYFNEIVNEYISYCGENNRKAIEERANRIKIVISNDDKFGEEPCCVKKGKYTYLVCNNKMFEHESGNVLFAHLLVHALGEESFVVDGKVCFNETMVDYIANDFCKRLEEKDINITFNDYPNYKSKSLYSRAFGFVEKFFRENKQQVLDSRLSSNFKIGNNIKSAIYKLEETFEKIYDKTNTIETSLNTR